MKTNKTSPVVRSSFVIYKTFYQPVKGLTDEEMGKLFRAIFEYQLNPDNPVGLQGSLLIAFEFFRNQFVLDNEKYRKVVDRNKRNGVNGGRPSLKTENPKNPVGFDKPKKPDNDNDNEKDNDKDLDSSYEELNKQKTFGDSFINLVMERFKEAKGHLPTDPKPRYAAYNLVRNIRAFLKKNSRTYSEDKLSQVVGLYFDWLEAQDWFDKVSNMDTIRRKFPIYQAELLKLKGNEEIRSS